MFEKTVAYKQSEQENTRPNCTSFANTRAAQDDKVFVELYSMLLFSFLLCVYVYVCNSLVQVELFPNLNTKIIFSANKKPEMDSESFRKWIKVNS